jgi:hypothetical protein
MVAIFLENRAFSLVPNREGFPKTCSMRESEAWFALAGTTPKRHSMRERVSESIAAWHPDAEAAELYGISASVAVIWVQRGRRREVAIPDGGSVSPARNHVGFLLDPVTEQPDFDTGRGRCGDDQGGDCG